MKKRGPQENDGPARGAALAAVLAAEEDVDPRVPPLRDGAPVAKVVKKTTPKRLWVCVDAMGYLL